MVKHIYTLIITLLIYDFPKTFTTESLYVASKNNPRMLHAAALQLKYFYLKSVKSKCKKLLKILRHKMFCVRIQFKRTKQHRNKRIIIYPIWSNMVRRRHLHDNMLKSNRYISTNTHIVNDAYLCMYVLFVMHGITKQNSLCNLAENQAKPKIR